MEHHRVRRPLVARLGAGAGPAGSSASRNGDAAGGGGAMTKGALVRRLERSRSARDVVAGLQFRQVSRGNNSNNNNDDDGDSKNNRGRSSSNSLSVSKYATSRRHSSRDGSADLARVASAASLRGEESFSPAFSQTSAASVRPASNVNLGAVRRARERFEEKARQRERMQQDMEALREQEMEDERIRQERRRRIFERERAERAKQLVDWKRSVQVNETQKKRREQRRKDKARRELDRGLKERQQRYAEQLREHERANRHKRPQPTLLPPLSASEASAPAGAAAKLPTDMSSRMQQIKSSYDPSVSSAKHLQIGEDKSSARAPNAKAPRRAKKMSDKDIVEMARRIVKNVRNGTSDPETSRALSQEDLSFLEPRDQSVSNGDLASVFGPSPLPALSSASMWSTGTDASPTVLKAASADPDANADTSDLDEFTSNLIARLDSSSIGPDSAPAAGSSEPLASESGDYGLGDFGDLTSNIDDWYRQQLRLDDP